MRQARRVLVHLMAILSLLVLSSCYSDFPLDTTPQGDLDEALLGAWRCLPANPSPTAQAGEFTFTRARDRVYGIRLEGGGDDPMSLEAYVSLVHGQRVLNVSDLNPRGAAWAYVRYAFLSPDVLRFQILQDDAFKGVEKTPAAYRNVVEGLTPDSPLYENYAICVRTKADGSDWK